MFLRWAEVMRLQSARKLCENFRQHAMRDDDPDHDWPVITARVPSSLVFTDGNDLAECGYVGDAISATTLAGS